MSKLIAEVNRDISIMVSFIKDKTKANVIELSRSEGFKLSPEELKKLLGIIDSSIAQGFMNGQPTVEKSLSRAISLSK